MSVGLSVVGPSVRIMSAVMYNYPLGYIPPVIRGEVVYLMKPIDPGRFDLVDLVKRYEAGQSLRSIAVNVGVADATLGKLLLGQGITLRGRSEARKLIAASENRHLRAQRGADTKRSQGAFFTSIKARRAIALTNQVRQNNIGQREEELFAALTDAGLHVQRQVAVDAYNLDMAIGNMAIEVHRSVHHPNTRPNLRRRTKKLLDLGWHVIYVWCPREFDARLIANYMEARCHELSVDPAGPRQYRVIRGNGEDATRLGRYGRHVPGRPSSFHDLTWLEG